MFSRTPAKTTVTDADGRFDFGLLRQGHYVLTIEDERGQLSDLFQVEVKGPTNRKETETIDISPV